LREKAVWLRSSHKRHKKHRRGKKTVRLKAVRMLKGANLMGYTLVYGLVFRILSSGAESS
jgi:hypothetical protein